MRGQEPVIYDVESNELGGGGGGGLSSSRIVRRGASDFCLGCFLFGWAFGDRLVVMSSYHNCLRSGPDVILQRREFIRPMVQFLHSYWRIQG